MDLLKGIGFKIISVMMMAVMSALIRKLGETTPVGQMVFFRSAFAILPVLLIYAWRGEIRAALYTRRPRGQIGRGSLSVCAMFSNFGALTRLPLADVTAIQFAAPLMTVALAAVILKERVRFYRWTAVAVGFVGVIVMLIPHFDSSRYAAIGGAVAITGATFAVISAFINAGVVIQTRRLTQSEPTSSIVFYFSLICALAGALTLPFDWHTPTTSELIGLIVLGVLGGIAQIFMTESFRFAPASVIAPFDYTTMLWALLIGYWVFGELPAPLVYVGCVIVSGAGLFVIWRERQLGLGRDRDKATPPPAA